MVSQIGHHLTVPPEEAPANSVPAAAVIRGEQTLFGITGRKGRVGGFVSQSVKSHGSTVEGASETARLESERG